MADEHKVYLDHLIRRESLRYHRSEEELYDDNQSSSTPQSLRMSDLMESSNVTKLLRKPDFQRSTWAWSPEQCVSLLDSIINEQVIPSIIMWSSPDSGYDFILDGGHRISVVMAWLNDDWGDKSPIDDAIDEEEKNLVRKAAIEVRRLVDAKIGSIQKYREAEDAIERMLETGEESPRRRLGEETFQRGQFFRKLLKGAISFHRLWVTGNYEKAEASFLKINKSGQQLMEWETKLIENRNSSFARAVMSISNVNSVTHYWPNRISEDVNREAIQQKITEINDGIIKLHKTLFLPSFQRPVRILSQPIMVAERQKRPSYVAELLTVIAGGKGIEEDTLSLLSKGKDAKPLEIVDSGQLLVEKANKTFEHLVGFDDEPKSLGIVPALYFYTDEGRHVRSLLYGFLYWLMSGDESQVLERKRVFCAYRASFELILLNGKSDIAGGITRKTGSGPEVTLQTAEYFDKLLRIIIEHGGELESDNFKREYKDLVSDFSPSKKQLSETDYEYTSRTFTTKQKSTKILTELLRHALKCGICGGMLDSSFGVQQDHITDWAMGGKTTKENQQLSHPFCNNQKTQILEIRENKRIAKIPVFEVSEIGTSHKQPSFFDDPDFF